MEIQFFYLYLLKILSFLYYIAFSLLSKIGYIYQYGHISGLWILFHFSICLGFFFSLILQSLDYYRLIVVLRLGNVSLPTLFFVCIISWLFWIFCLSICILESNCWYPYYNLLGFWSRLPWIYKSIWEELTSWQYRVFLLVNMKYLSTYLVLLWFSLSDFCSFTHIEIIPILLVLYLSISIFDC